MRFVLMGEKGLEATVTRAATRIYSRDLRGCCSPDIVVICCIRPRPRDSAPIHSRRACDIPVCGVGLPAIKPAAAIFKTKRLIAVFGYALPSGGAYVDALTTNMPADCVVRLARLSRSR